MVGRKRKSGSFVVLYIDRAPLCFQLSIHMFEKKLGMRFFLALAALAVVALAAGWLFAGRGGIRGDGRPAPAAAGPGKTDGPAAGAGKRGNEAHAVAGLRARLALPKRRMPLILSSRAPQKCPLPPLRRWI